MKNSMTQNINDRNFGRKRRERNYQGKLKCTCEKGNVMDSAMYEEYRDQIDLWRKTGTTCAVCGDKILYKRQGNPLSLEIFIDADSGPVPVHAMCLQRMDWTDMLDGEW